MAMEAEWYVDPLQRFSGRLFDGTQWTDQVSDDGTLRTDPDWPPTLGAVETPPEPAVGMPSVVHVAPAAEVAFAEPRCTGEPGVESHTPSPQRRRGMMIAERRDAGDRRQINTPRHNLPERRKSDRRQRVIVIPKA